MKDKSISFNQHNCSGSGCLSLNEFFLSIQGESTYAGLPCIFIRTSGCNLSCNYCDTQYHTEINLKLTSSQILSKINEFLPVKLVEITGGEPLLQDGLYELISQLNTNNFKILLETNGSILLDKVPDYVCKIIDVKCPGSGEFNSFLKDNLHYFNPDYDNLKFVISDRTDYIWARGFLINNKLFGKHTIFSAAYNRLKPELLANWIIEDRLDIRMQLQLHKYIWDPDTKGV